MHDLFRTILFTFSLLVLVSSALAFDNDFEINDINLSEENFLDIKAHRFRKSLEYNWYDHTSAWRMTAASLDGDLAFIHTELKLQQALSDYVNIRLEAEQEVFYADKEFALPTTEIEYYPWAGDLGFSFFGTPAYEKRDIDLGVAVIWGRRPWNYTRFEYVEVDSLYNDKNMSDNTYYSKEPISMKLEGAYRIGDHYKLRFAVQRDESLELFDPDTNGLFNYEGNDYFLLFDYQPVPDSVVGITVDGFSQDKSKSQTGENQSQVTDYLSVDAYWVQGMGKLYEFRLGAQYDQITNDIRDFITASNDLNYFMDTFQLYSTVYHPFNEHMAWDVGLHVGQVEERHDYLLDDVRDEKNEGVQAKFRMGFEYSSADGLSSLQVNISLNVDDPINDPGDGGGISFHSVF